MELPPFPFPELEKRFDSIAGEVWHDLRLLIPKEFHPEIERIEFIIEDEPSADLLKELPEEIQENPEELFGLHAGIPLPQEMLTDPSLEPVRVYLFRWALLDLTDPEDPNPEKTLREEIAVTLLHEVGHYFGLEEDDLERLGYA